MEDLALFELKNQKFQRNKIKKEEKI
jgi:hypothetical protein